jgi:hypothetical protein
MRAALLVASVALLVGAVPSAAGHSAADLRLPRAAAAGETTQYGHIKSLRRVGARYQLRFDPALWLGGVTAERAAVEDGAIRPGQPVPNDYYIVDEGHRLLTFLVPKTARVTVLTNGINSTRITIAELAQIVKGRNPRHRPLYDRGNNLGYWLLVSYRYPSAVRSIDQQYQP